MASTELLLCCGPRGGEEAFDLKARYMSLYRKHPFFWLPQGTKLLPPHGLGGKRRGRLSLSAGKRPRTRNLQSILKRSKTYWKTSKKQSRCCPLSTFNALAKVRARHTSEPRPNWVRWEQVGTQKRNLAQHLFPWAALEASFLVPWRTEQSCSL